MIVQYVCHRCDKPMNSVFFMDRNGNEICRDCFDATRVPVSCEHCSEVVAQGEGTPTKAGGVAHVSCALKVTLAMGLQRAAVFSVRRSGPAFRGVA